MNAEASALDLHLQNEVILSLNFSRTGGRVDALATKIGNYLCRALPVGGCADGSAASAMGYVMMLIAPLAIVLIVMHRSSD
jgi:hypothetical protein